MKNLPEFKALIDRYESITIDEIESKWGDDNNGEFTANLLTGFGAAKTCTLCISVNNGCGDCAWMITKSHCCTCNNRDTYSDIEKSISPIDLFTAFRARAAYMREVLKKGGVE